MNEIARDLARRAGLVRLSDGRYAVTTEQELATLIGLVAEECARIVDENNSSWPYANYGQMITEHFSIGKQG